MLFVTPPFTLNSFLVLQVWQTHKLQPSTKIAAFDYDGCLAKTSLYKKGPDAWSVLYPEVPIKLKQLCDDVS